MSQRTLGITGRSRLISREKTQQIHRDFFSKLRSNWACRKPFDFCRDDRTHSLLIISLFNLDLWALVFQSTWSIRIEVSLKCVRVRRRRDRPLHIEGGMDIYAFLHNFVSAFSLSQTLFSVKISRINCVVITVLETNTTLDTFSNIS